MLRKNRITTHAGEILAEEFMNSFDLSANALTSARAIAQLLG